MKKYLKCLFALIICITIGVLISGCGENANKDNDEIEESVNNKNYYKINYFLDGGINDKNNLKIVLSTDERIITFGDASKEYYSFDGWFLDENFTEKYTPRRIQSDINLYAKFTCLRYKTIIHNSFSDTPIVEREDDYGTIIYLSNYYQSYYGDNNMFKDWYTTSDFSKSSKYTSSVVLVTKDIELYALVEPMYLIDNGELQGFYGNYSRSILSIPEQLDGQTITKIGNNAFRGYKLSYLHIPKTVEEIGDYAFYNCGVMPSFQYPSKTKVIGSYAFAQSSKSIKTEEKSLILPSSVETIKDHAFYNANLTNITLNSGIKSIGDFAFWGQASFTTFKSFTWDTHEIKKGDTVASDYYYDIYLKYPVTISNSAFDNYIFIHQPESN